MQDHISKWRFEMSQPFTGWDFSYLKGRLIEEGPPWSYHSQAKRLMKDSSSALDLGTGGGERLIGHLSDWPELVVATEAYPPNITLAAQRIHPLGGHVVALNLCDDGLMPFQDHQFGVILNRHSPFNPVEVARILARGGTFLTQQVHGLWMSDLLDTFGAKPQWPDATLEKYVPKLKAGGLDIVNAQDWSGEVTFSDVGAIVYYLKAVPWLVPGFTVDSHLDHLMRLQNQVEQNGALTFTARKYLIEAKK